MVMQGMLQGVRHRLWNAGTVAGSTAVNGAGGSMGGSTTPVCGNDCWMTVSSASSFGKVEPWRMGGTRLSSKVTSLDLTTTHLFGSQTLSPLPLYLFLMKKHIVTWSSSFLKCSFGSTIAQGARTHGDGKRWAFRCRVVHMG